MRWDDVQVFLEVAQQGSLAGAARELSLNHSTVYRRLRALEADLGVTLFDRDSGRYTLTEAGSAVLPEAEAAAEALLAFRRGVEGQDRALEGLVRLTAPESLLPLLAPHLAPFRERYPNISVQMAFSDRFLDLERREADVALRPTARPEAGAVGRRVSAIAWTVYAPAGVPESEVRRLPWATYSDDLQHLAAVRWWEAHHGGADTPVLVTVNSVPAMRAVICEAGCRGMLPCFAGDADVNVVRARAVIPEAASALWLLAHPDLRHTARIRALVDYLWAAMRQDVDLLEGRTG
jgi:DNA-binding transcriptional LysR family regulator